MSNDLVSILIPCHNSEKWIEKTLQSALFQSWHDKEIIIVDDGSTDDSLANIGFTTIRLLPKMPWCKGGKKFSVSKLETNLCLNLSFLFLFLVITLKSC